MGIGLTAIYRSRFIASFNPTSYSTKSRNLILQNCVYKIGVWTKVPAKDDFPKKYVALFRICKYRFWLFSLRVQLAPFSHLNIPSKKLTNFLFTTNKNWNSQSRKRFWKRVTCHPKKSFYFVQKVVLNVTIKYHFLKQILIGIRYSNVGVPP